MAKKNQEPAYAFIRAAIPSDVARQYRREAAERLAS